MSSILHRSAIVRTAACFVATLFAVSGLLWDPVWDGVSDDLMSPRCRAAWEGRPCVVSIEAAVTEGTGGIR